MLLLVLRTRVDALHSFFFNTPATTELYTLSLHDALPISRSRAATPSKRFTASPPHGARRSRGATSAPAARWWPWPRSEEHTSELQSRFDLVCRLLLEKKKLRQPAKPTFTPCSTSRTCWNS